MPGGGINYSVGDGLVKKGKNPNKLTVIVHKYIVSNTTHIFCKRNNVFQSKLTSGTTQINNSQL